MKVMSTPYESGGRSAQKAARPRALIAAARELVAAGATPTVEDAAEAASVSRTTAYRYFPSKRRCSPGGAPRDRGDDDAAGEPSLWIRRHD